MISFYLYANEESIGNLKLTCNLSWYLPKKPFEQDQFEERPRKADGCVEFFRIDLKHKKNVFDIKLVKEIMFILKKKVNVYW
mgnify:CR=1 FL=1